MNLNRLIRLYLLLLFALLQCVAPLAHAHVNGDNADGNVHLASIDSAWLYEHSLNQHDSAVTQLSVEHEHSAVVCVPPESRGSEPVVDQPIAEIIRQLLATREHGVFSFAAPPRQILSSTPYQHPYSQAPPA